MMSEKVLFGTLVWIGILIPAICGALFLFVLVPLYKSLTQRTTLNDHQWEAWTIFLMFIIAATGYLKFGPLAALVAFFGIGIVSILVFFGIGFVSILWFRKKITH